MSRTLKVHFLHVEPYTIKNYEKRDGMGSKWDTSGREWVIKERPCGTCPTDSCAPAVKRVTGVMIKRDIDFQIR